MECTQDACFNRGKCVQQWNSFTCDCDMTSYTGIRCADGKTIAKDNRIMIRCADGKTIAKDNRIMIRCADGKTIAKDNEIMIRCADCKKKVKDNRIMIWCAISKKQHQGSTYSIVPSPGRSEFQKKPCRAT